MQIKSLPLNKKAKGFSVAGIHVKYAEGFSRGKSIIENSDSFGAPC